MPWAKTLELKSSTLEFVLGKHNSGTSDVPLGKLLYLLALSQTAGYHEVST